MCGIAAIIGGNNNSHNLKKMLHHIKHRGDPEHFFEAARLDNCHIGMNRLAIVDRQTAQQPIFSYDNRYCIVFNGEIYNYADLKLELENTGIHFSTNSDTEVIVNGYAAWGTNVLDRLRGMFAFIIYDTHADDFFIARDPIGIKPLYYAQDQSGLWYFASEVKAFSDLEVEEVRIIPPGNFLTASKTVK